MKEIEVLLFRWLELIIYHTCKDDSYKSRYKNESGILTCKWCDIKIPIFINPNLLNEKLFLYGYQYSNLIEEVAFKSTIIIYETVNNSKT